MKKAQHTYDFVYDDQAAVRKTFEHPIKVSITFLRFALLSFLASTLQGTNGSEKVQYCSLQDVWTRRRKHAFFDLALMYSEVQRWCGLVGGMCVCMGGSMCVWVAGGWVLGLSYHASI